MRTLLLLLLPTALLLGACLTPRALQDAEHAKGMGLTYLNEGNTADSIREYRESVKKNRWDSEAWHGLGLALFAAGSHAEAEEAFLEATSLNPEFPQAEMNLGSLYLELERWDDAITHLKAAVDDPEYRQPARARHNLGWAYYSTGSYPEAREQYREVLRRFPLFCPSVRNLAQVDEAEGKLQDALARFRQAQDCDPADLNTLVSLGMVEARLDLLPDACQHLTTVTEADPYGELRDQAVEYLDRLDCESLSKL